MVTAGPARGADLLLDDRSQLIRPRWGFWRITWFSQQDNSIRQTFDINSPGRQQHGPGQERDLVFVRALRERRDVAGCAEAKLVSRW